MKTIGITGGVGAGKSQILAYLEENYNARVLRADEVAHLLEMPGQECYDRLVDLLGSQILCEDGNIDKRAMAQVIFSDEGILAKVNAIIHPEVKKYILEQIDIERGLGSIDFFFVEAALLIEEHYDEILDEMWYIYTDEKVRRKRLKSSRGYSDQKISDIIRGQLGEDEFRSHCDVVIDNSGTIKETYKQIQEIMGIRV